MRKHNVTLNRIFDKAVEKGFITQSSRPPLDTKGQRSVNYATFDIAEVNALLAQFPIWIENTITESKIEQRQMLYDYVRVLIDTGARPGKELLDLQWKNIRFNLKYEEYEIIKEDNDGNLISVNYDGYDEDGEPIQLVKAVANIQMSVWGKTKDRIANGFDVTYQVLNEIIKRNYTAEDDVTLKSLTESNDERYVFRTKSDKAPSSFNHLFDFYLKEHNLLIDRNTGKKRVFYSLRSAHATAVMNLDKVPIRDLSKQLGNSVGMIQNHYDRATGDAIVENVRAPIARRALFNTAKVSDIYKSNKKHK
jgi:integrase